MNHLETIILVLKSITTLPINQTTADYIQDLPALDDYEVIAGVNDIPPYAELCISVIESPGNRWQFIIDAEGLHVYEYNVDTQSWKWITV